MNESTPKMRNDLEFIPVQHEGRQLVLIRDHLGLVQEGKAVAPALYHIMALLNGSMSMRDLQWELMRQRRGLMVDTDAPSAIRHLSSARGIFWDRKRLGSNRFQVRLKTLFGIPEFTSILMLTANGFQYRIL